MQKLIMIVVSVVLMTACVSISEGAKSKYGQGITLWEQGEKQQAISVMQQAIDDSPEYYDAYVKLGEFYFTNGSYQKAISVLDKAIALNDSGAAAMVLMGRSYLQSKQYLKSQKYFSMTLKLEALDEEHKFQAYLGKGICKLYLTLYEDAQEYLQKALTMRPGDNEAVFHNALLREKQMGPNAKTMSEYKIVLANKPEHAGALLHLAETMKNLEQHQKAVEYYHRYLKAGGDDDGIKTYLKEREIQSKIVQQQSGGTKISEDKKLYVCPQCHRIYKQGQGICDYDGSPLVPQE